MNKETAMLVDIQYAPSRKQDGLSDILYTIWRDTKTDEKFVHIEEKPQMPVYIEKEEFRDHSNNQDFKERDKCRKYMVPYNNIPFFIANNSGAKGKQLLNNIMTTNAYGDINLFFTYPYVFGADYDIRAYKRFVWRQQVGADAPVNIHKAFLDIEVNGFENPGFPSADRDPIDLITLIDSYTKTSYTFAYVNQPYTLEPVPEKPRNFDQLDRITQAVILNEINDAEERNAMRVGRHEQEQELIKHPEILENAIHNEFDENYPDFKYEHYFFENELEMLISLFNLIHLLSPDFLEVWNMGFDIPYIINRITALGGDPTEIICDEEFPNKVCKWHKDRFHFDIANKTDWFECTSKTVYRDQMEDYGAIRKGQGTLRSFKLDYIAGKELHDSKYLYEDNGTIKTIGYRNYLKYYVYNIKDVLLQHGIDDKTDDIMTVYKSCYSNITPYDACFKQTEVLRNVQYRIYDDQGLIPGCNVNRIRVNRDRKLHPEKYSKKRKPTYEGALVGDPLLILPFGKRIGTAEKTNKRFRISVDMDMTAFYPSSNIACNISGATLIGKIVLDSSQYECSNLYRKTGKIPMRGYTYNPGFEKSKTFSGDMAGECIDNFQTQDILAFGRKWLNLPSVTEMAQRIRRASNSPIPKAPSYPKPKPMEMIWKKLGRAECVVPDNGTNYQMII